MNDLEIIEYCHMCSTKLDEEKQYATMLCNDCADKIKDNLYTIIICKEHNLPCGSVVYGKCDRKKHQKYEENDECLFTKREMLKDAMISKDKFDEYCNYLKNKYKEK